MYSLNRQKSVRVLHYVVTSGHSDCLLCSHTQNVKPQCEPPHDRTNKMACAPSEDSDQPGHPPSLIRVFTFCMKKA